MYLREDPPYRRKLSCSRNKLRRVKVDVAEQKEMATMIKNNIIKNIEYDAFRFVVWLYRRAEQNNVS